LFLHTPPSAFELRAYENIYISAADDGRHEALAVDAELTKALREHQKVELHPVEHVENEAWVVGRNLELNLTPLAAASCE
jgi:hypothetical protein